ncbi:hypothetical protein VTO42DRAFT_2377 [Malbranchea cinnamomea]
MAQQGGGGSGGSNANTNRGVKWTDEEETWLVINSMYNRNNEWLQRHLPGGNNRTLNSIAGHFNEMRMRNRLPRAWRAKKWDKQPKWTIDEDTEVLLWHVWGRNFIDPVVFVPNNRAGGAVVERADYLAEDEDLVEKVCEIEEHLREEILERDLAKADEDGETNENEIRRLSLVLRRNEDLGLREIRRLIHESLCNQEDADDEDDGEGDDEDGSN